MTLTGVYGFWKYVSNLERRETRRYIEMFYALKYRSLVSRLMPASASASACQRGSRVRSHSSSLKRVNELLTHLFLESRQARFRCPSISTGKEEEEEAQAGEPSPAFRSVSPQFALLVVYWSYVYLVSKNFGSFLFFFPFLFERFWAALAWFLVWWELAAPFASNKNACSFTCLPECNAMFCCPGRGSD